MCKQIEEKQNEEYYKEQRQIHNAIMGDTPVKTAHNRQYIDNISAYDSELQRISKSVHHKLDLGQNSLLGAQQYTTVKAAADIKVQDKDIKVQDKAIKVQDTEDTPEVHMSDNNGQNNGEIYRRAEYIIESVLQYRNCTNTKIRKVFGNFFMVGIFFNKMLLSIFSLGLHWYHLMGAWPFLADAIFKVSHVKPISVEILTLAAYHGW